MMRINHCIFPEDILYDTENFVWADLHHDKRRATLGITSILGHISGKLSVITLREVGSHIKSGKSFGTLAKLDELLEKITIGNTVHLVSDDITADLEMIRWSDQTGQSLLETRKEGNLFHFIVKKVK